LLLFSTLASAQTTPRDGSHDFDSHFGTWKTHLSRLQKPLAGSKIWAEFNGTTLVRKVWNGSAGLVELNVDGPAGHIEALGLRLYNPDSKQWSLNLSNIKTGMLSPPMIGEFKNGRGEFYSSDTLYNRAILTRFVITSADENTIRFEQSFSGDGGKTWELNWVAVDTRVNEAPVQAR
jgi:hypothetical protein